MCGICGTYNYKSHKNVSEELIDRMCRQIIHRGPDDQGIHVKDDFGFGMRRLSIIDVEGGHQPIHNEDKSVWVVLNGEIYNFKELREELEKKGHVFTTNSDTEIIVHAYETYGLDCIQKLRGMFAFALWDYEKKRLFMARDRVGKKPLYYAVSDQGLVFGSEIKSILEDRSVKRSVNLKALDLYLTYLYVPSPLTMFEGIYKLPPAGYLICEKGKINTGCYWRPDDSVEITDSEDQICEKLRNVLKESVKLRMISDVPLGAFLSGGIDSSIVVALMAEQSRLPIKTFSIGFNEKEFSELKYARIVAERFGTEHHEMIVTPNVSDLVPKLVWHYNEPFADSSAIPTYYLSQMTRQSVKVALSGDGGDELFAGYTKYLALKRIEETPAAVAALKKIVHGALSGREIMPLDSRRLIDRILRSVWARTMSFEERDRFWDSAFKQPEKDLLYSVHLKYICAVKDPNGAVTYSAPHSRSSDPIGRVLFSDFARYLPDDLLVKVDVASMANSLEVRCPFLDHILVEFAMTIPAKLKLRSGITKYLLKKAFARFLPDEILNRDKAGFAIPLDDWLRNELREWTREVVLSDDMKEFFNMSCLKRMLDSHFSGRSNLGSKLWAILNFSLWHKMFIKV